MQGKEQNSNTILNPNTINEFKIIVVDFIANLKSAIYSKQDFQYKLLPYLEYPRRSLLFKCHIFTWI
jgi:hypothetical protein